MFNVITSVLRSNPFIAGVAAGGALGTAYLIFRKEEQTNLQKVMAHLRHEGKLFTNPSPEELERISEYKKIYDEGLMNPSSKEVEHIAEQKRSAENPDLAGVIWPFGNSIKDVQGEVVDISTAKHSTVVTQPPEEIVIPDSLKAEMTDLAQDEREDVIDTYRLTASTVGEIVAEKVAMKSIVAIKKRHQVDDIFEFEDDE